jgi:putative transposase
MRKKREWYPGALYHIMARGNYRQDIVRDNADREVFLELLRCTYRKMPFMLHAFCLMTNHYHFLIETGDEPVWKIMKCFSMNYAQYYNGRYERIGHLFQGRYKSCLVTDDAYFLQTSRYIHLNPVKAHMAVCAEEYRWSSYRTYMGIDRLDFVTTDKGLAYFVNNPVEQYRDFTESTSLEKPMERIRKDMGEDSLWLPW